MPGGGGGGGVVMDGPPEMGGPPAGWAPPGGGGGGGIILKILEIKKSSLFSAAQLSSTFPEVGSSISRLAVSLEPGQKDHLTSEQERVRNTLALVITEQFASSAVLPLANLAVHGGRGEGVLDSGLCAWCVCVLGPWTRQAPFFVPYHLLLSPFARTTH